MEAAASSKEDYSVNIAGDVEPHSPFQRQLELAAASWSCLEGLAPSMVKWEGSCESVEWGSTGAFR